MKTKHVIVSHRDSRPGSPVPHPRALSSLNLFNGSKEQQTKGGIECHDWTEKTI